MRVLQSRTKSGRAQEMRVQESRPAHPCRRPYQLLCRARSTNAQSPHGSPIVLEQSEAQPDRRPTDRCVALSKRSSSNPICGVGPDDGTNVLHRELTDNSPQRRPTRPAVRHVEARRGAMGASANSRYCVYILTAFDQYCPIRRPWATPALRVRPLASPSNHEHRL